LGGMRRVYNSATQAVKHPLFSGSALMIGGSMVANVVNYFYHLLMGRVLGPKDYGTLASIYAVMYILSIVPTSTSFAIVKFISSAGSKVERTGIFLRLRKLVFQIAVVLSLVFLVLSPVVSNFLHIENVYILVLVSLVLFF
jgi:O-antigen/teichoic acid export membrane protein